jgi:dolichol-phosphate mannosyltransferase
MLSLAQSGYDVVVGSRFAPGGSLGGQPFGRRVVSIAANLVTRTALGLRTRDVLTGYVLCRREAIAQMPTRYSAGGFKFLLELLSTRRDLRVCEWPIVFQDRVNGHSKASISEGLDLARLCALLLARRLGQALRRR